MPVTSRAGSVWRRSLWFIPCASLAAVVLLLALSDPARPGDSETPGIHSGRTASDRQSAPFSRSPGGSLAVEPDGPGVPAGSPASSDGSGEGWVVEGVVLEHDGTPATGSTVAVYRPGPAEDESGVHDAREVARTTVTEAGHFRTEVPTPGDYHVCAYSTSGTRVAIEDVQVSSRATRVELVFDTPGAIAGSVIDAESGAPIAEVEVGFSNPHHAWFPDGALPRSILKLTGSDGRFGPIAVDASPRSILVPLPLVNPPSPITVTFVKEGYERDGEEFDLFAGRVSEMTVRLRRAPEPLRLQIRVVDEAGRPVPETGLTLYYAAPAGEGAEWMPSRFTDAVGRATIVDTSITWGLLAEVACGSCTAILWVAARGFRPARHQLESLMPGQTRDIDLVLVASPRITGTVVDENGRERPGMRVWIDLVDAHGRWDPNFAPPECLRDLWRVETDAEGRFEFDSLFDGTYSMRLEGMDIEFWSAANLRTFVPGDTDIRIVKEPR